jgi:hypothetical protein
MLAFRRYTGLLGLRGIDQGMPNHPVAGAYTQLTPGKQATPCTGYFLRYVAYFYRFYVLYAMYHPLLCLAEASRLGYPF